MGGNTNTSQYYKKSQKISKKAFKELFAFDENDRDKKSLKKDFRKIEKAQHSGKVKFKHLIGMFKTKLLTKCIDYYLTSSENFGSCLKGADARSILESLESEEDRFNERVLKLLCVN